MHWRQQACAWLRADLAAWTKLMDDDSGAKREVAKRMLSHWQVDSDLAGLHDPRALEELSTEEHEECRQLWNDVAIVLDRGRKPKEGAR